MTDAEWEIVRGYVREAVWLPNLQKPKYSRRDILDAIFCPSRAKRGDTAKQIENKQLLEPLLVALQKLDAMAAARATRKKTKQDEIPQGSPDVTPAEMPPVSAGAPSAAPA